MKEEEHLRARERERDRQTEACVALLAPVMAR